MFRFSKEGSGPEEMTEIREPNSATFEDAYQSTVQAIMDKEPQERIRPLVEKAKEAANAIEDSVQQSRAFREISGLERTIFGESDRDDNPGGAGNLDDRLRQFLDSLKGSNS